MVSIRLPRHLALPEMLLIALPFAFCLYPAIALLVSLSEIPTFFNMYSRDLLLLNTAIVLSYVGMFIASWFNWRGLQFTAILLVALLTFVGVPHTVRNLPLLEVTTQLVRAAAGVSLIVVAFLANKQQVSRWSGIGVGIGAVVLLTALIDFSFSSAARLFASGDRQFYSTYRTAMDLGNLSEEDIVLVGDSFVWGWGVPIEQRVGDVLERKLGGPRVYSLGIPGADVGDYNRQILDIPAGKKVKHVIVLFCDNDMPPRPSLRQSLEKAIAGGGRSRTARVLIDLAGYMITWSPELYAQMLLDSFAKEDRTFELRWSLLEHALRPLYQKATERSLERPTLVILPMLVDFASSFDEPHRRVAELAEQIGFRALDATASFLSLDKNLEHFRAARSDFHLNERGNVVLAEVLLKVIKNAPVGMRP
jgi:lysophospholipase L1-like esterase